MPDVTCPQSGPLIVHVDPRFDRSQIRLAFDMAWQGIVDTLDTLGDPDSDLSRAVLARPPDDLLRFTIEPNVGPASSDG